MKFPNLRTRSLRKGFSDTSGQSGLEFAFIVPALAVGILFISDVANIAMGASQMQTAVRTSIQYAMNGGSNMTVAQTQGVQAWANMPTSGTLSAAQSWRCGSGAGTAGQLCPDGSVPTSWVTVVASATLGGTMISQPKTVTESVRIQ
jgi:Flp pilus assembly protein TadG